MNWLWGSLFLCQKFLIILFSLFSAIAIVFCSIQIFPLFRRQILLLLFLSFLHKFCFGSFRLYSCVLIVSEIELLLLSLHFLFLSLPFLNFFREPRKCQNFICCRQFLFESCSNWYNHSYLPKCFGQVQWSWNLVNILLATSQRPRRLWDCKGGVYNVRPCNDHIVCFIKKIIFPLESNLCTHFISRPLETDPVYEWCTTHTVGVPHTSTKFINAQSWRCASTIKCKESIVWPSRYGLHDFTI